MPEEGFLRRWARVKATGADPVEEAAAEKAATAPAPVPETAPALPSPATPVPDAPVAPRWARAGDTSAEPFRADAWATAAPAQPPAATGSAAPTLADIAELTPDSDYSMFVGQGVDKSVQRLALKKLFSDPHFNVMDRLDMYMDDYNVPSPVSEAMLAQLDHARSALRRFVDEEPAPADTAGGAGAVEGAEADKGDEADKADEALFAAEPALPHAASVSRSEHDSPQNEAAHEYEHQRGPFHRPNQQLPQGQV